jgi:hypothetical protein
MKAIHKQYDFVRFPVRLPCRPILCPTRIATVLTFRNMENTSQRNGAPTLTGYRTRNRARNCTNVDV